jgi:hypothetical protein
MFVFVYNMHLMCKSLTNIEHIQFLGIQLTNESFGIHVHLIEREPMPRSALFCTYLNSLYNANDCRVAPQSSKASAWKSKGTLHTIRGPEKNPLAFET